MAVAVENERLIRESHHWSAARHMQRALLPRHRPEIPGYAFWECYRPALEVGGDFYDYIRVPPKEQGGDSRWVVCLGDVSGKGMPAALMWAAVCPEITTQSDPRRPGGRPDSGQSPRLRDGLR